MVCTANDLLDWKDFPKGLRVLLLDEDTNSAAEMRSKLEEMNYIVSTFQKENEALLAISNKSEAFHVAIVEVNTGNSDEAFKFLETAKDLPTIMTSNIHCLNTMMKCIALGAVEFLQKPLSDDKLRNIWQHVVHKAFNAGEKDVSESLKPVKESIVSMLQLESRNSGADAQNSSETIRENSQEFSSDSDKYPAPSTPQLKQGARSLDDSVERDEESKSVETTCCNSGSSTNPAISPPVLLVEASSIKGECKSSPDHKSRTDAPVNVSNESAAPNKPSRVNSSSGTKANKKKLKVDWTPELHKKFVKAVEQLGVDAAIPSRILEVMKVEGLTRHNVASHLQKYRMHRRQILPKDDAKRWPNPRDSAQRSCFPRDPILAFPPYHSPYSIPTDQYYPAWVQPGSYSSGVQMWGSPYHYPGWQSTDNWHWKPHPGAHANAWGCPVMPSPQGSYPTYPQNASGYYRADGVQNRYHMLEKSIDFQPAEEVIDKVVKEAINKPWLPLPLGLKPPSTECVLNELLKQGISTIPHKINGSHTR
ncbi:PREDICTED: two-component response regulator-like APRR2 isoform X2 [Ipomoea nil]|uniref:two-component response regulator-like APRR2 isoform X2 n=1 Tax=Ipomoea nil TaxID=35883 RepID=UPI000900A75F|nr:PREDICTED: two-component response regulator-like APRR2 isoform X2 [Ipomoea nil]